MDSIEIIDDVNANQNSYLNIEFVDNYFNVLVSNSTWLTNTDEELKKRALITATQIIDRNYEWRGFKVKNDQPLQFPRKGVIIEGEEYSNIKIPLEIKQATAEIASRLLSTPNLESTVAEPATKGIESLQVGSIKLNFDKEDRVSTAVPDNITLIIRDFIKGVRELASDSEFQVIDLIRA